MKSSECFAEIVEKYLPPLIVNSGVIDEHTSIKKCDQCLSSDGKPKNIYPSKYEADNKIQRIFVEENKILRAYRCPNGKGWHLTKSWS